MGLAIDQWNVEARPGGWLRLRETSGTGPAVYLHYAYGGPAGQERLDLREVVMRAGSDEPLSARTWRRIPLLQIERALTLTLRLARSAPTAETEEAGRAALALFTEGIAEASLDHLDDYFAATQDATRIYFHPMPSGMLVSDGAEGLPQGRIPQLHAPEGRLTDEFLTDVADVYRWVVATGQAPAPAIAEMSSTPVRTVQRWIYEARKRKILPPARPGRAG